MDIHITQGRIFYRFGWDVWAVRSDFVEVSAKDFEKLREIVAEHGEQITRR